MSILMVGLAGCCAPAAVFCYFYGNRKERKHLSWKRSEPHFGAEAWERYQTLNAIGWHKVDAWHDATAGFASMAIYLFVAAVLDTFETLVQLVTSFHLRETIAPVFPILFFVFLIAAILNFFNSSKHAWKACH